MKHRWASLISGSGTTMQAIAKAAIDKKIPIEIACIISSTKDAPGIQKAKAFGINPKDILVIDANDFKKKDNKVDQEAFGKELIRQLTERGVTIVTQNGWLPLTPVNVIEKYEDAIFNQHSGPLPDFGGKGMFGKRIHAAVLIYKRMTSPSLNWTEATVQRVGKTFDEGAVVLSEKMKIMTEDSPEELQQRMKPIEHKLQIKLLKDFVAGKIKEEKRKSIVPKNQQAILEQAKKKAILLYPNG